MTSASVQTSVPDTEFSSWSDNPLYHGMALCLVFIKEMFAAAEKGHYRWVEDEVDTDIIITGDYPVKFETLEKRPAIVGVRSQASWAGIGLDQMRDLDIKTGERTHTDMVSGNYVFNCISRVDTEAENIAWVLSSNFWLLRRVLLTAEGSLFHDIGKQQQVGAPTPAQALVSGDTEGEAIAVPVVIPYHIQWTATARPEDQLLLRKMTATLEYKLGMRPMRKTEVHGPHGTAPVAEYENVTGANINPPGIRGRTFRQYPGSQPADPALTLQLEVEREGDQ